VGGVIFKRHPARPFLLLVALATNAVGVAILGAIHPASTRMLLTGLGAVAIGVSVAIAMRRTRVKSFLPYLIVPGALCWWGLFVSGMHPALALVPVVPFMPHARRDAGLFVAPSHDGHDALSRFERWSVLPIQLVLFLFGLANAGVPLHGLEPGVWALPAATLVGRPIGVLAGSELALAAGLRRMERVGWRELLVVGCTASTGLTTALFFSTAVLPPGPLLTQMETGALLTAAGVGVAFLAAKLLRVGGENKRSIHGDQS
jgi:NhaA family Na+:H+ antiporter